MRRANPSRRFFAHKNGLFHAFLQPRIVSGTPTSLLKLFSLLRTKNFELKTVKIASFVDVFPTLPVTAIICGLYFFKTKIASHWISTMMIFLRNCFIAIQLFEYSIVGHPMSNNYRLSVGGNFVIVD